MMKILNKRDITTAIEISGGWAKLAKVKTGGRQMELLDIAAVRMPPEPLSALLKRAGRAKTLITSIDRQSVTIRFLTLPSVNPDEIEGMVEFQSEKQLPFPKEELVTGSKVLQTDQNGYSRVMLAIAHRNIIQERLSLFKSSGAAPARIALSTESILNYFLKNCLTPQEAQKAGVYCIVDLDHSSAEILIAKADELIFSRAVSPAGGSMSQLLEEVKRSFRALKKDRAFSGEAVQNIFICGSQDKRALRLKEALSGEFNIAVELLGRFKNIIPAKNINGFEALPEDVSFSNVLGLAADAKALQIDLLPREIKDRRRRRRRQRETTYLALMSLLIFAGLFSLQFMRFYQKKAQLMHLNEQLVKIEPRATLARIVFDKLKLIKEQSRRDNSALEAIRECYKIIPQDMNLSMLSFHTEEGVILRGTSSTMARIFEMVSILEKSDYLENVKVVYANKRKIDRQVITDFQIRGELTHSTAPMPRP